MERTLLLVDDEENITSAMLRLLRVDGYKILCANSGRAGLELLTQHEVGVIVSDQRMPEMTGVEFFIQVKALYPKTIRMMLSGYADLDAVTDAINRGSVYKFLNKPWDDASLSASVQEAFRRYELVQEDERLALGIQIAKEELARLNLELTVLMEKKNSQIESLTAAVTYAIKGQ